MIAEIITIGDELLIGQVVDTNSAWLSEQLNLAGIKVHQITSISDDRKHILDTLREVSSRADIVLMTGGLGPTKDDITKKTLCEYFDTELIFSEEAYHSVERLFSARGLPVTALNRDQAMVPACCKVLINETGTAPGMWFERDGTIYISMPGVPFEMKYIFTTHVVPELQKRTNKIIIHRTILTEGIGESFLAAKIADWENTLPEFIKLAYLPQPGMVRLRLTASGTDKKGLSTAMDKAVNDLLPLAGEYIFGEGEDTLQEIIGKILREKNKTLGTAESCTGGYLAHLITSIPGSSDYFTGSVVAYSNRVKEEVLRVKHLTLTEHGAVSEAVVKEMVKGLLDLYHCDYAIAISGIAGPSGGTAEKPVGTTWIAVGSSERVISRKFLLGDHRGRNIQKAAISALSMLRKMLIQEA